MPVFPDGHLQRVGFSRHVDPENSRLGGTGGIGINDKGVVVIREEAGSRPAFQINAGGGEFAAVMSKS